MSKIYADKENIVAASVNAAKATLTVPLKAKTQGRKPFSNVGNTIRNRQRALSPSSKPDIKSLEKSSPQKLVQIPKADAIPESVVPTNDDDWPEIEHMPPFYEPEDDYEDIWPREERFSRDDLASLKCLQHYKFDTPRSPLSPAETFLLEFGPLDQSMFQMDCLEEPSELNEYLYPVPMQGQKSFNVGDTISSSKDNLKSPHERNKKTEMLPDNVDPISDEDNAGGDDSKVEWLEIEHMPNFSDAEVDNYEGIWPQEEKLSNDDLMSLKFLQRYKCTVSPDSPVVSPISPLGQCTGMFEMDSFDEEPCELNESLDPLPHPY